MDSISINNQSNVYSPLSTGSTGKPQTAGAVTTQTPVEAPGQKMTEKGKTLEASDKVYGKLKDVGSAQPSEKETVREAVRAKSADSKEATAVREDYKNNYKEIMEFRDEALKDYKKYSTGTHKTETGEDLTITKDDKGRLTASYSGVDNQTREKYSRQTEFNEKDERNVTVSFSQGDYTGKTEKRGTRMEYNNNSGSKQVFDIKGDKVTEENWEGGSISKYAEARKDGSARETYYSKDADGKVKKQDDIILPDMDRAQREKIVKGASFTYDEKGRKVPLSNEQLAEVTESLSPLKPDYLQDLRDKGLKFAVVDPKKTPPGGYPGDLKEWPKDAQGKGEAGGYYESDSKTIVYRKDMITRDTSVHEAAHAADDLREADTPSILGMGGKVNWESENNEKLKGLFNGYKDRSAADSKNMWNDYALTNEKEYVAKGFEAFSDPVQRTKLKDKDPGLYEYVEQRMNKK
ncbi:MAG: hypothetical protein LWY06_05050 [Firmicutes bacterium]|nr:hypothetical protein [Bacillota bacterium]